MNSSFHRFVTAVVGILCLLSSVLAETPGTKRDKIGIYDLNEIHSIPLNPEVVSKTEDGDLVYERVRFSSVDNIRVFALLSYRKGASKLPGLLIVDRFKAVPKKIEASNGYFTVSVAPPDGNLDPQKDDSVGGPKLRSPFSIDNQFLDDPHKSYIYQHTVALIRALDYLETRPEVDLTETVVTGFSWPGLMVATLHGLDDRPCAYVLFHGLGYYADKDGLSGGQPALFSAKANEMYGAATYAPLGTKPIFIGVALDDFFTKLDTIINVYNGLKCEKAFAYAPNRSHDITSRDEFNGQYPWQTYWQFGNKKPSSIGEGTVKVDGGKAIYSCTIDETQPLKWTEVMISYGPPGNWTARTWHTFPLVKNGTTYQAEIPIYDPKQPFYAVAQLADSSGEKGSTVGNGIQQFDPSALGISSPTATYPSVLFDPSLKSDLYLATGTPTWAPDDSQDGKGSAIIKKSVKFDNVMFQNIEPNAWKDAKELHLKLKGDGKPGPFTLYFTYDGNYFLDKDIKNYTAIEVVKEGQSMPNGWFDFAVDLSKLTNLDRVSLMFIESGTHTLQLGTVYWK